MKSIARRLFWTQLLASVGLALLVGILIYLKIRESLADQFDQAIGGRASSLSALMHQGPHGFAADFGEKALPEFSRENHKHYMQVVSADGRVLYRSKTLAGQKLPAFLYENERVRYRDFSLPDGNDGRLVVLRFVPGTDIDDAHPGPPPTTEPAPMILSYARSREELDERMNSIAAALALAAGALCVGIVAVTWFTMKSSLLHLRQFAADVEGIDIAELSGRVAEADLPIELTPIATRLNQLLHRLEEAFGRERRFTANAAHELRTPIAELRTLAEVALRNGSEAATHEAFYGDALAIAKQMESLTQALLALARGQSIDVAGAAPVDASALALEAWQRFESEVAAKGLFVTSSVEPRLGVRADPVRLRSILSNLLGNAVHHTLPGGAVDWRLTAVAGEVRLVIQNSNDSLTTEDLAKLSEPFWRKSAARTGGERTGLGLALVTAWSQAMGARVEFSLTPDNQRFITTFSMKQVDHSTPALF